MMTWAYYAFGDLTNEQLYQLLQLRQKIFIVEQNCPYLDADGSDQRAIHLIAWDNKKMVAALRLIPSKLSDFISSENIAIGRLVVDSDYRGQGLGRYAIKSAIEYIKQHSSAAIVFLSGQTYLDRFYRDLGFVPKGDIYLEDNIEHQYFELAL